MQINLSMTLAALAIACGAASEAAANPPMTRQARACLGWHETLSRRLAWSEAYAIHPQALRDSVRDEAEKLRPRCIRDISLASLNRYVMLVKLLHDDQYDETESFD